MSDKDVKEIKMENRQIIRVTEKDVCCFDVSDFDNLTFDQAALIILNKKEQLQEKLGDGEFIKLSANSWNDTEVEARFYRYESDEEYEARLEEQAEKKRKEHERDLATLKKLQAKYPDITIEL